MRRLTFVIVAIHALVLAGHDAAHRELAVHLNAWQTIFAYSVIVVAPVLAVALVFTRYTRFGFGLLAFSMLGALVFGVYHHYIVVSPDHVGHLPAGELQALFRLTAAMMPVVEFAGLAFGVWGWHKTSPRP